MKSSLGFHTMTLSLSMRGTEVERLIKHLWRYQEHTKNIKLHVVRSLPGGKIEYPEYRPLDNGTRLILPLTIHVLYSDHKDHGIRWTIRCDRRNNAYNEYALEARINPKILGGVQDYITAASYDDMETVIRKFDAISGDISLLLGRFRDYKFKRVDYCINFDLSELAPGCTSKRVIELIKRADVPPDYSVWTVYDETAHRKKSNPNSFYLKCGSVNINCYRKTVELQQRSEKTRGEMKKELLEASQAAQDIIRFEVQCKYPKMYALSMRTGGLDYAFSKYHDLLGYPVCLKLINYYYKLTISGGDWFSLPVAQRIIKRQRFNKQKEERLLNALGEVNQCRSLSGAKAKHQGGDLVAFKRTLKDLTDIGINPVTIPREWGIKRIPNLLHTYIDLSDDRAVFPQMQLI